MNESEIRRLLCEILCVSPDASAEQIRQAYTTEAKKWHPDRVQHNAELAAIADKKLKEVNQAYECLTDRNQFDKHGAKLAQRYSGARDAGARDSDTSNSTSSSSTHDTRVDPGSSSASPPVDKSSIVKIFVATGIFVIIVVLVANLTAPRRESEPNPGVTLSPSQSPAAPFPDSGSPSSSPTGASPPDSSVAAPPASN